jgi:NADPH-dependent 7-cyano-7-deazaguanine reductase QueF-like protein
MYRSLYDRDVVVSVGSVSKQSNPLGMDMESRLCNGNHDWLMDSFHDSCMTSRGTPLGIVSNVSLVH